MVIVIALRPCWVEGEKHTCTQNTHPGVWYSSGSLARKYSDFSQAMKPAKQDVKEKESPFKFPFNHLFVDLKDVVSQLARTIKLDWI